MFVQPTPPCPVLSVVGENKDNITAAIDSLFPTQLSVRWASQQRGIAGDPVPCCGFGTCAKVVLEALAGGVNALSRVIFFLGSLPDRGLGALDAARCDGLTHDDDDHHGTAATDGAKATALLRPFTTFYSDLALDAADAHICCDLFAASNAYLDLASLRFLTVATGGNLFHYTSLASAGATLAQDIYRALVVPHASRSAANANAACVRDDGVFDGVRDGVVDGVCVMVCA